MTERDVLHVWDPAETIKLVSFCVALLHSPPHFLYCHATVKQSTVGSLPFHSYQPNWHPCLPTLSLYLVAWKPWLNWSVCFCSGSQSSWWSFDQTLALILLIFISLTRKLTILISQLVMDLSLAHVQLIRLTYLFHLSPHSHHLSAAPTLIPCSLLSQPRGFLNSKVCCIHTKQYCDAEHFVQRHLLLWQDTWCLSPCVSHLPNKCMVLGVRPKWL